MKWFVVVGVFIWLVCGVSGALMLEGRDGLRHWKVIARGPITLAKGFNEHPVTYPG